MGVACGNTRLAYAHDALALLVGAYSPVLFLALFVICHAAALNSFFSICINSFSAPPVSGDDGREDRTYAS